MGVVWEWGSLEFPLKVCWDDGQRDVPFQGISSESRNHPEDV